MIIKHNTTAETIGNLKRRVDAKRDKQLEKLASGLKINRAADDAAGLAISEKMRAQIRGLNQASSNCEEGIDLLKTVEGALDTVHEELQRMREMAVQSANGAYTDSDREALQAEFSALGVDIDRISQTTEYNTIPLFKTDEQILGPEAADKRSIVDLSADTAAIAQVKSNTPSGAFNVIYDEITYDFATSQTPTGDNTSANWDALSVKETLQKEIVPNVVENILTAYPAFNYLQDSSIGIGLNLYSDPSSNVLAYVSLQSGGNILSYNLSINMATVNLADEASRIELEHTISHEMMHAFMDEALTNGMTSQTDRFPLWFIEGMAQTASGPGNWVASMGLNAGSSVTAIQNALQQNALTANSNKSNYGTGYLACMYLGYQANGGGAVTAQGVSDGLSKILAQVMNGKSLDEAFQQFSGYASVNAFVAGLGTNGAAAQFVKDLLIATGTGAGGVVSGDLTAKDLVANDQILDLHLFQLNTSKQWVQNDYSGTGVHVNSGGGTSGAGAEPIVGFDPDAIPPVGGTTAAAGDFQVTTNVSGGYTYSSDGVLTISQPGNYTISLLDGLSSTTNKIRIVDGVHVTLNGVHMTSSGGPCLEVLENASPPPAARAKVNLIGDNSLQATGGSDDAVHLQGGAQLTIHGSGSLRAESAGGNGIGGGAKVVVQSGTVIADGAGGAGDIDSTEIVIEGGSVAVDSTGVPPTLDGTVPAYRHAFNADTPGNAFIANAASVTVGGKSFAVAPDSANGLSLWLEGKSQSVVVTDTAGVQKTYILEWNSAAQSFSIAQNELFTVNGMTGSEASQPVGGVAAGCSYDSATGVLTIKAPGNYQISGGSGVDVLGNAVVGQIVIDVPPGTAGDVNLTFDGVDLRQTAANKAAVEIKSAASVHLTLAGNNILAGTGKQAALQVGTGATLNIDGNGVLQATGGSGGGAGIGGPANGSGGAVVIEGGVISARGGGDGAAIGSGASGSCGGLFIGGGAEITAVGGSQAAGIGAGASGICGDIAISGNSKVNADASSFDAGIGTGIGGKCGKITIDGNSEVVAKGGVDGAGIGTGLNGECLDIVIGGNSKITASGYNNAAGIGGGWHGICGSIEIGGTSKVNTSGGKFGAGIGSGKEGSCDSIEIKEQSVVVAKGGELGAGIGSGERGVHADITISGGTVHAEGGTNGTGIGGGRWATAVPGSIITLSGGSVTAIGGLSANGGNIGAYTDTIHETPIKIVIGDTTVQAGGPGEGLYSTTGAVDDTDEPIYAYPVDFTGWMQPGFQITAIHSVGASGANDWTVGITADGEQIQHKDAAGNLIENSYIWMHGEDQEVTITYTDPADPGVPKTETVKLKFFPDSGLFRPYVGTTPPAAPPPAVHPNNPSNPDPGPDPTPPRPDPTPPPVAPGPPHSGSEWEERPVFVPDTNGLKLQIGANAKQMMIVPLFWLSMRALSLQFIDIATPDHADQAIDRVDQAIRKVSGMRSTYGALQNRLEHVIEGNNAAAADLTATESRIRDADMAQTMLEFQLSQIQSQASQAMLAQANQLPQAALELLE